MTVLPTPRAPVSRDSLAGAPGPSSIDSSNASSAASRPTSNGGDEPALGLNGFVKSPLSLCSFILFMHGLAMQAVQTAGLIRFCGHLRHRLPRRLDLAPCDTTPRDVADLTALLDLKQNCPSNEQRARFLQSSNSLRDGAARCSPPTPPTPDRGPSVPEGGPARRLREEDAPGRLLGRRRGWGSALSASDVRVMTPCP